MTDEPPGTPKAAARRRAAARPAAAEATGAGQAARRDRLAGALRDNLHRRKAQARARRSSEAPPGREPGDEPG